MLRNQTRSNLLGLVTLTGIGLVVSLPTTASAQTTYYTGTASTGAWNTARWSTSSSGPFNTSYAANSPVRFTSGSYSFAGMGATTNVGNVSVLSNVNVNFASAGSTYATNGTAQTVDVAAGGVYDLGSSQAISTAAGTGFLKTGAGVFALSGATYSGGFTLNAGTVILRGVNAMGQGGALALNGGAVAGSATRNLTDKYAGGITIGGNVQFGEFSSNVALANDTANLTFSNNMALGSANRTLTLGNRGNVTFGGVIANTSGGITFAAAPGAGASVSGAGRFEITGTSNTFTGDLSFTGAEVRFANNGSLGNAANNIVINGGRFGIVSGASFTIPSSRSITVGDAAGTSIATAGSGTLTYDGVIANISGTTGSWVKQGGGTLSLGGSSTYTGATTIANGTIQLTADNDRLPTTTVLSLGQASSGNVGSFNLNSRNQSIAGLASIVGTNAAAVTNLVTTATSGTLTINVASGTTYAYGDGSLANSGLISGAVSIVKSGSGAQILGGANTYTGTTTLSAGTLRSGTGTVGNSAFGSGVLALNGGTLTSGTDNGARTFANNVSVGGDVAFGDATATGGLAFSGTVDLGNATRTLTTVQTLTFSGPISNGGLIKSGTALLTMTGNNTYSGATTVSAGGLKVNGVLGSGSLSVAASAWLMGTGTINGPVTISGTLTPGASPGVITLGSLVLTPTSSTVIEIASAGTRGTDYDGVSILDAGGLTYGGTMTLAFGGSAIDNNTTFDVFSFTGSSAGSLAAIESSGFYAGTWTPLGSGTFQLVKDAQTITFSQSSGDVIVVPEPTTITLAAVGLGAMAYAFRRRHIRA